MSEQPRRQQTPDHLVLFSRSSPEGSFDLISTADAGQVKNVQLHPNLSSRRGMREFGIVVQQGDAPAWQDGPKDVKLCQDAGPPAATPHCWCHCC